MNLSLALSYKNIYLTYDCGGAYMRLFLAHRHSTGNIGGYIKLAILHNLWYNYISFTSKCL